MEQNFRMEQESGTQEKSLDKMGKLELECIWMEKEIFTDIPLTYNDTYHNTAA